MIDASTVLADASDHPGCRASADGSRVLLTAADGLVVRMYECRGMIDASLIAVQVDQHLRPLEALADEVAARMAENPGATLVAAADTGPAAGTVALYSDGRGLMRGWWAVGTYTRGLQLIALVAARHCPHQSDPTPRGISTRARRRQRQQGHS